MSISAYTSLASELSPKSIGSTPPSQPIPGREAEMKLNHTGGFTFVLDQWAILDRFIMIGSEGGGAYVGERDLTKEVFTNTLKCIAEDGVRAINRAVEYSVSGRAPKNDPAIVVLALAAAKGSTEVQAAAYAALPKVARIGTHLFTFVNMLNSMGKWNAAAKRGVSQWYTGRQIDRLAVQLLKYQSRNGWSHRDVLRLAHVKPQNESQTNLFKYVVKGAEALEQGATIPQLVVDFEYLKRTESASEIIRLIGENKDISWELIPTQFLKNPDVLMALLPTMKLGATIRFLGRLAAAGVTTGLGAGQKLIVEKLSDAEAIKDQRLHPIGILQAMKQYSAGRGERGSLIWQPNQRIVDALDDAFYASFTNVEDTGMGQLLGIDCSGSMWWESSKVNGSPNLVAAEVAACFALGLVKRQSNYWIGAFGSTMKELKISPTMRLDAVLSTMQGCGMGGTDISLPMLHAAENKMDVDLFTVITDNELNQGRMKPSEALRKYRKEFVNTAKLAVMATSVSEFTVADPKDGGMMDIAGFDSATPAILADFAGKR